jgi:hypothetical protein
LEQLDGLWISTVLSASQSAGFATAGVRGWVASLVRSPAYFQNIWLAFPSTLRQSPLFTVRIELIEFNRGNANVPNQLESSRS